jgi:RNA polymerase sigma-70 factor (ECF subfamily)
MLFNRYYDRLFQFLLKIVKSKEVAEELVMDVFLKMWLARDMVPEIENLDGFLFRVAYNKTIDFFRSAAKDRRLKDAMWKMTHIPDENYADAALAVQEYEAVLRKAIDLLPPQRKKIFLLHQNEGLSHTEIAGQLGISKNTVANTLVEARQFIKAYLAKNLDIVMLMTVLYPLASRV